LEVVDFDLEVINLLVFLQFKLLTVHFGFEFLKLSHHHPHLATEGVKEILLSISAYFLDNTFNVCQLLINQVKSEDDFLSGVQVIKAFV